MTKSYVGRLSAACRRTLVLGAAVAVPLVALGSASPALATPKGAYAVFSDCPVATPGLNQCIFSQVTKGEVKLGSTAVPINKTITLQGGTIETSPESGVFFVIPAKDGNSLSKTELQVPGGLLNLIKCNEIKGEGFFEKIERGTCEAIFENKTTGVGATTELAATMTNPVILNENNLIEEKGTALTLPVKVHLTNPLLGSSCYIGSEAHPIQLQLTDGTTSPPAPNKPISGKRGTFSSEEGGEILVFRENALVDNSFSAPVAEGCGGFFSFLINPIINAKIGLPSAAGKNTAILSGGTLKVASAEAVIASE